MERLPFLYSVTFANFPSFSTFSCKDPCGGGVIGGEPKDRVLNLVDLLFIGLPVLAETERCRLQ